MIEDIMIEKLRNCFSEMVVYKDLKKSSLFSDLKLPSFMRDWLLKKFEDENGHFESDELVEFVRTYLPRKEDWRAVKDRIIIKNEQVKFLAKISIDIDIKTGEVSFSLPDFDLKNKDTMVDKFVWDSCKDELLSERETWGIVELGYRHSEKDGKIKLVSFKSFCPYTIDIEYYKDARKEFSISEWIDILLGAVDYNANGYSGNKEKKLTMLTRLLPFIEKRLNLIELAPKGTGKSYIFGRISRFGWLSSGTVISRAKMFYDMSKNTEGLVAGTDFITIDEVQNVNFSDVNEMRGILKDYLEYGKCTVGIKEIKGDAGVILSGNIEKEIMDMDGYSNMFEGLSADFHEAALIDRFHGFIKGWNIPRINEGHIISGWALNSEYFCSIMHELRDDISYRAVVDKIIEVPDDADKRHTEAVKRITTAYLKLLFPNVREPKDISEYDFKQYCLYRACKMRETILIQLGILDVEYRGKDMPTFNIRSELCKQED